MKKLLWALLFAGVISLSNVSQGAQVTLTWDATCDPAVSGFNVYVGSTNNSVITTNIMGSYTDDCGIARPGYTNIYYGLYTNTIFVSGITNNRVIITNLVSGFTYAFSVAKMSSSGLEGFRSTELIYSTPIVSPPSIQGFSIKSITSN